MQRDFLSEDVLELCDLIDQFSQHIEFPLAHPASTLYAAMQDKKVEIVARITEEYE